MPRGKNSLFYREDIENLIMSFVALKQTDTTKVFINYVKINDAVIDVAA